MSDRIYITNGEGILEDTSNLEKKIKESAENERNRRSQRPGARNKRKATELGSNEDDPGGTEDVV